MEVQKSLKVKILDSDSKQSSIFSENLKVGDEVIISQKESKKCKIKMF